MRDIHRCRGFGVPVNMSGQRIRIDQTSLSVLCNGSCTLARGNRLNRPKRFTTGRAIALGKPGKAFRRIHVLNPIHSRDRIRVDGASDFHLNIGTPVALSNRLRKAPNVALINPEKAIRLPYNIVVTGQRVRVAPTRTTTHRLRSNRVICIRAFNRHRNVLNSIIIHISSATNLRVRVSISRTGTYSLDGHSCIVVYPI